MSADDLISRLSKARKTGAGRTIACCPAHPDKSPSLSITEKSDGLVLLRCFAGCSAAEIVAAVGLELSDLFPEKLPSWEDSGRAPHQERSTFAPSDILRIIAAEALDVAIVASDLANGAPLTDATRERLWTAAGRISNGLEATNATR
jgi:DNA primase